MTAAIETFIAAANAYAVADEGVTTHDFTAAGFRVNYMGEQLQTLTRA